MWNKMTIYDSESNRVMEFTLVNENPDQTAELTSVSAPDPDPDKNHAADSVADQVADSVGDEQVNAVILNLLARFLPTKLESRQQVSDSVRVFPAWVQIELSKAFTCLVREVPFKVADKVGFEIKTDSAATETPNEEKIDQE